jgi:hypothetical protein
MRAFFLLPIVLATACVAEDALVPKTCPEMNRADTGELSAFKAQRCNVSGSMGAKNWYRLSAMLPDSSNYVQVELWPERGAFRGGPVRTGTFQITGDDAAFATCGVCLRAVADKGLPTEREYFATGGTVEVTAVSATENDPFVATVSNAVFAEVDTGHEFVTDEACTVNLDRTKINGVVMIQGGGGGGGGGGGNGGTGGCKTTVGD